MPNFKKSDGFSLGGNPFTMKKGSKEITTDGSFRKEATDKMGRYGSPLFAIAGREGRGAGAAYEDTTTDMGKDVDAAMSEGKAFKAGQEEKKEAAQESITDLSTEQEPAVDSGDDGDKKEKLKKLALLAGGIV